MKYFVCFDGYGHVKGVVNEKELATGYEGDPQRFLRAMCTADPGSGSGETSGHVGTLTFESELELKEYLESCGDVITGFFECESDSRPYNF
jgi:hypothetical protein